MRIFSNDSLQSAISRAYRLALGLDELCDEHGQDGVLEGVVLTSVELFNGSSGIDSVSCLHGLGESGYKGVRAVK